MSPMLLASAHKGKRLLLDLCKQSSWTVLHPIFDTDKSFAGYAACKTSQTHPAALKPAAALIGHPQSSLPLGKLLKFCLLLRLVEFLGHKWCLEKKKNKELFLKKDCRSKTLCIITIGHTGTASLKYTRNWNTGCSDMHGQMKHLKWALLSLLTC